MDWIEKKLEQLEQDGLYRRRRRVHPEQGVHITWRGRRFINFASNDYLNLAGDRRLKRAAMYAARKYGAGAGASPLVSGYHPPLRRLERDLARCEATEAALVFSSGYAANIAAITALARPEDIVFSDALNHASIIDGCRLARAHVVVYRHVDAAHLQDLLKSQRSAGHRCFIVSETLFSMDGDLAPLAELAELAERHDAMLLLDEAHATGVLGERGFGLADSVRQRIDGRRLVKIGTLSKALASQGGFVCGSRLLIDWLVNRARPYIFSTALAPACAAAARRALHIIDEEPERRRHLLDLGVRLRDRLRRIGYLATGAQAQIVPIVVGEARLAVELSNRLAEHGLLVPAIRPPSVPDGTACLRISLTAGHTEDDLQRLLDALQSCTLSV